MYIYRYRRHKREDTDVHIAPEDLRDAISACGFKHPIERWRLNQLSIGIEFHMISRNEAAMFIAHCVHETRGFQHVEELSYCSENFRYELSEPGKSYHGRGYIRLCTTNNYRDASLWLGRGDELLKKPELVSEDSMISLDTAIWIWAVKVRPHITCFDDTTTAIYGALESSSEYQTRYEYYVNVADVLGITEKLRK